MLIHSNVPPTSGCLTNWWALCLPSLFSHVFRRFFSWFWHQHWHLPFNTAFQVWMTQNRGILIYAGRGREQDITSRPPSWMKVKKLRIKIKATLQGHSREFSVNLRSQSSEDPVVPDSVLSRRVPISREEKRIEERFVVEIEKKKKEAFCFPRLQPPPFFQV